MKSSKEWISISDMMTGLMMVFLFIAVLYIDKIEDSIRCMEHPEEFQKEVKNLMERYDNYNEQIYVQLKNEFNKELEIWDAKLDRENLTMSFSRKMIFLAGDTRIKQNFKKVLDNFCPRYFKILYKSKEDIKEIRIEGHTSREWDEVSNRKIAYFNNMELSQDRTRSVLEYCIAERLSIDDEIQNWILKKVTANGLSSSQLKCDHTDPDELCKAQNRRVEFRVQTNETAVLKQIKDKLNNLLEQLKKCKKT